MKHTVRFFLLVTALVPWAACLQAGQVNDDTGYQWPGGQRAAISLAYDDALNTQLDVAIPQLDRHGLKGSFYVVPASAAMRDRIGDWRAAAANGHELGNHTLFHACRGSLPNREWVSEWSDLDTMSVEEITARVELANTFLEAVDGLKQRTFTATCFDQTAGGKVYLDAIEPMFIGIKIGGGAVVPDMATLDPYRVPVTGPVDMSGEELIAIARQAAEQGTMANYTFHGIGGDHLSVSAQAHDELLAHLAANPDVYWVSTFVDIMTWVTRDQE
ncbi:polysaccharide deacetylase family protein [Marinihelvus fidelis]|uniref:Polysaccharide deacetylase family protein n=1 Tax=Marinihelvus fidelis TaxID=2613842 RepID=A0A5N0TE70_9GAMM|nr:polysaccharide deacetylase family protein [Marinihelvus fidelis]KAA9132754.1 polysaccharide deacetylase family protein [Marinihelvus fidelis]